MNEVALRFGQSGSLVGILTDPPSPKPDQATPAVILLNAGLVHRVGPNRLYVEAARRLSALGLVVLRFDFSGIGDSDPRGDRLSSDSRAVKDVAEAMDCLAKERGSQSFLLIGICSGAVRALNTACADPRVAGAALVNPQGFDDTLDSYVQSRRYWRTVLLDPRRWFGAMLGKGNYRLMRSRLRALFVSKGKTAPAAQQVQQNFRSLVQRGAALLLVFSAKDAGLRYLSLIFGGPVEELTRSEGTQLETITGADHTFTSLDSQERFLALIQAWASGVAHCRTSSSPGQKPGAAPSQALPR